jgi:hypothetical protein
MISFMKPSTDWMLFNSFETISSIVKIYWPFKSCTVSSDIRSPAYRKGCLKVVKDTDYCQNIFTTWRRYWQYYIDRKYVLLKDLNKYIFFLWRCSPTRARASPFLRFLDHTKRRTTASRTPLSDWSAHRRDLYLITHNIYKRQTSMPPAGFKLTIWAGERPETYAFDCAASGTAFK